MFRDWMDYILSGIKKVITSRLFIVTVLLVVMFGALVLRLFNLQILNGEQYQESYLQTTYREVSEAGTRGEIRDCNGYLLAYNELAYAVTVTDTGDYPTGYEKNIMLLRLIEILNKHEEETISDLKLTLDSNGNYAFTVSSEAEKKRFLRDIYGLRSTDELDQEGSNGEIQYSSDVTAEDVVNLLIERYGIGKYGSSESDGTYEVSKENTLKLINMRYAMAQSSYRKYEAVTVANNIDESTLSEILENAADLKGVDVDEQYIRVYNDSEFFAHIIGYTGKADSDDLETLQSQYPDAGYEANDIVGKTGIEQAYEGVLQGTKGTTSMYTDSEGRVVEIVDETEASAGQDIYLTIDRDLQVGLYYMIEQHLAGIISAKLRNYDVVITPGANASDKLIGIKEVYFNLIDNNVLDLNHFSAEDASATEQQIYQKYAAERTSVFSSLSTYLNAADAVPYSQLSDDMKEYVDFYISYMEENGYFIDENINTSDSIYQAWQSQSISLREYLEYAISQNWLDTSKLSLSDRYTSMADTFSALIGKMEEELSGSEDFAKKIYKTLIYDERITGCEICLALFDQGILAENAADYQRLQSGSSATAFSFMVEKINNIEITPAQLALDLCSASVIITDPRTGEIKAMVSYPGYDNNQLSGTVNADYYNSLLNDKSTPLINRATQVRTAPGSIFKIVTTTAGLEEGVLSSPYEEIYDDRVFTKQGYDLRCYVYPGSHGSVNVMGAIRDSCNYYFSEVGYRLAMEGGTYSEESGLSILQRYASMYGLNETSGVEVSEIQPIVSDSGVVPSAIGQGTNAYAHVHLSRYVTTIASRGNLYTYTLVDKITTSSGELVEDVSPQVEKQAEISDTTWDAIYTGMRMVITDGATARRIFSGCQVEVAGKTGTAEFDKIRPNHATFMGFAPYNNPEVAVSVQIPYGYTSTNPAKLGREALEYYFGLITLEEIIARGASQASSVVILD